MNLQKISATAFVRRPLLWSLACVLGAVFLITAPVRASTTIGRDPFIDGNAGSDLSIRDIRIYVPFVFNLDGLYTLDSVQVPFSGDYSAGFVFGITPTLGIDSSHPSEFTPLSLIGESPLADSEAMVLSFSLESPAVFTSGLTYYLTMGYAGVGDPRWVTWETSGGSVSGGDPSTSGGTSSGGPPGGITLMPLTNLTSGRLMFR